MQPLSQSWGCQLPDRKHAPGSISLPCCARKAASVWMHSFSAMHLRGRRPAHRGRRPKLCCWGAASPASGGEAPSPSGLPASAAASGDVCPGLAALELRLRSAAGCTSLCSIWSILDKSPPPHILHSCGTGLCCSHQTSRSCIPDWGREDTLPGCSKQGLRTLHVALAAACLRGSSPEPL